MLLFVYLHGLGVHSDYPRDLNTFRRPCVHNEGPTLERALVHSEVSQLTISTGLSQNQTYSQRTESAVNRQYYQTKIIFIHAGKVYSDATLGFACPKSKTILYRVRTPNFRALSLGIFRNKNIIIPARIAGMEIQEFRNENSSQTNAFSHYSNYSGLFRIDPKRTRP